MENLRPFQLLRVNINQLRFDCPEKFVLPYKQAFDAVLVRLDEFFHQHNYYSLVDYQEMVERLLRSKTFSFKVAQRANQESIAGTCSPWTDTVFVDEIEFGRKTQLESVLCHEFIHYITVGQKIIHYERQGLPHKLAWSYQQYGSNYRQSGHYLFRTESDGSYHLVRDPDELVVPGNFLCEGFTEIMTGEIYPEEQQNSAYQPHMRLVSLLNRLFGKHENWVDFLQCNYGHLSQIFGGAKFTELRRVGYRYHEYFRQHPGENYLEHSDYQRVVDLVCQAAFADIAKHSSQFSAFDLMRAANTIVTRAPGIREQPMNFLRYQKDFSAAIDALCKQHCQTNAAKNEYAQLLRGAMQKLVAANEREYTLPEANLDFTFRQETNGFAFKFMDSCYAYSENLTDATNFKFSAPGKAKQPADEITFDVTWRVPEKLLAIVGQKGAQPAQVVQVAIQDANQGLTVLDRDGRTLGTFDFVAATTQREKLYQEIDTDLRMAMALEQSPQTVRPVDREKERN